MEKQKIFKRCAFIAVVVILITIALTIMLKYEVEGEQSLPYAIDKILMVSTVDGDFVDDSEHIWNINVTEINDLYMYISQLLRILIWIKNHKKEMLKYTDQLQI